jgi:alanyl-tRNA synthetase
MKAVKVIDTYINFFKKQGHKQISNSPIVPENDPTTLFTSSGMQPLVPYLLGEVHPQGKRLVDVQNCFRAQDIEEVGDNRHTTFFRMIGNWSLGDYFKKEQLPWFFIFLTKELGINPKNLYITVFEGYKAIPKDTEAIGIWKELFAGTGIDPKDRISAYGVTKNWWSRTGVPDNMPAGEPGGPDSEVFFDYGPDLKLHEKSKFKNEKCHVNCDCGRYLEIGNSVFMEYQKQPDGSFKKLPQQNVDFGGGLERLVAATEGKQDIFTTTLFSPIIQTIEKLSKNDYSSHASSMRIVTDHLVSASFIAHAGVTPSNKEQGYILRRLIRRGYDHFSKLGGHELSPVIEAIAEQYKDTDPGLVEKFELIKYTILEETKKYNDALEKARHFIEKKYIVSSERSAKVIGKPVGDELMGVKKISVDDAFLLYSSHGLSPTQIKSLGYTFDEQAFAEKMEEHQKLSRKGAGQKFSGGLADHQERTIMGHTATHLLHKALRDILGEQVHQTGSNITTERLRFDFNYDQKLTNEQLQQVEETVNKKIEANLQVHYDLLPIKEAKKIGAIGLFDEKYGDRVKVYFIGTYSKEICGGPHVDFTGRLKSFKIIKQENIGNKQRRIYASVG